MRQAGYEVTKVGTTQRIIPIAISQKFVIGDGGELLPLTEGSTRPVTSVVTHAGVRTVHQYELAQSATMPEDPAKRIVP